MSDIQSPCEKSRAAFGGNGKLLEKKPDGQAAQKPNLLPTEKTLKDAGLEQYNDLVALSDQSVGSQEPSQIKKLYQAVKDCPVKPLFGSVKGVKVRIKTDLI